MKLSFDKLETALEEPLVLAAEVLLDEGRISSVEEVEKGFWLAFVQGNEVEIQLSGKQIKSFTCECADFQNKKICAHTVAGMMAVRKKKSEQKEPPKPAVAKKENIRKLTVSAILEAVQTSDLLSFISEYARRDQQFSTALKARFASSVQHLDLSEKYGNLLATLVKTNQSANLNFTKNGAKKIHDTVEMLLLQAERELAERNYAEVFEILKNIIEKITPILPRLTAHRNDLLSVLGLAYGILLKLSNQSVPPAIRDEMALFAEEIIKKRHFFLYKIEQLFFQWLLKLAGDETSKERLLQALDIELERRFHNRELESKLWFFKAAMVEKEGSTALKNEFLKSIFEQPWLPLHLTEIAYEWGAFGTAKWLAHATLQKKTSPQIADRFEEILLQIASKEQNKTEKIRLAHRRLLATLDINYFDLILESAENQALAIEKILRDLQSAGDSEKKNQLLATIFYRSRRYGDLFDLIEKTEAFDLLLKFATALYAADPRRFEKQSWQHIQQFLGNHIGPPASVRVRNFLRQLFQQELREVARKLLFKIRKEFGDRPSLAEELEIFGT